MALEKTTANVQLAKEWTALTEPFQRIQQKPIHVMFIGHHLAVLHHRIETEVYKVFSSESAYQCMNLIRAAPITVISHAIPPAYRLLIACAGILHFATKPALSEHNDKQSRIKLLNSIATALFIKALTPLNQSHSFPYDHIWAEIPACMTLAAGYFWLASQINISAPVIATPPKPSPKTTQAATIVSPTDKTPSTKSTQKTR